MSVAPILLTGAAGFIGMHVAARLLSEGRVVVGVDNVNDYYDPSLKEARLGELSRRPGFRFVRADVSDDTALRAALGEQRFETVIHLAAQAGVRYSIDNPRSYIDSNLVGFANILELVRAWKCRHLLYASSSSVYGGNTRAPFSEIHPVDHPLSLYAATKKANELMAHTYSHLYGLPSTGLRFFTVYGPWGRPDMAAFKFVKAAFENRPIQIFNRGKLSRDFTYIDDVVDAVVGLVDAIPTRSEAAEADEDPSVSRHAPFRVVNVGNSEPVVLEEFVDQIERACGRPLIREYVDMQPGDVYFTHADRSRLDAVLGPRQHATSLGEGIDRFVDWYRRYYQPN